MQTKDVQLSLYRFNSVNSCKWLLIFLALLRSTRFLQKNTAEFSDASIGIYIYIYIFYIYIYIFISTVASPAVVLNLQGPFTLISLSRYRKTKQWISNWSDSNINDWTTWMNWLYKSINFSSAVHFINNNFTAYITIANN